MPLTKLDPTPALVIIDLQKGIVSMPTVHPTAEIVARAGRLAKAFRKRDLPVVLVNVSGSAPGRTDAGPRNLSFPPDWTDLVPELDHQPTDITVTKQRWGAFLGTSLDADLRQRGVTQVVLVGVATTAGVESTARSAYDLGYNLVLVLDAITDRDADAHRNAIDKTFPRIAETANTEDVLKLL
jgi:nicotinamidase-related amidase